MSYSEAVTTLALLDTTAERCGPVRAVSEIVRPVVPVVPLDDVALAAVFKALGSPIRLRLLAVIQASVLGEACVCDLVDSVGLSQSTVSHHLATLVAAGLLRREQRGTWAWYALVPERLEAARRLVD